MHQRMCVTQVLWCMPGSLTSRFLSSWWRGKPSRHSRRSACATRNYTYLLRGPCSILFTSVADNMAETQVVRASERFDISIRKVNRMMTAQVRMIHCSVVNLQINSIIIYISKRLIYVPSWFQYLTIYSMKGRCLKSLTKQYIRVHKGDLL